LTVVIWSCCIIVPTTMAASGLLQPARKSWWYLSLTWIL
jgi:hypothetical protein